MSNDPQESLDLFDEHEEIVSEDGKEVKRKGIFLLPNLLTTAALFSGFFSIVSAINGNFVYAGMAIFAAQLLEDCMHPELLIFYLILVLDQNLIFFDLALFQQSALKNSFFIILF